MTFVPPQLTVRPLSGPDELDLFRSPSYVLDHELADDLSGAARAGAGPPTAARPRSARAVRRCSAGAAARGEGRVRGPAGEGPAYSVDGGRGGGYGRHRHRHRSWKEAGNVRRNNGTTIRSTSLSRSRPVRRAVSDLV